MTDAQIMDSILRSRWLRLRPGDSFWLIGASLDFLPRTEHDGNEPGRLREYLNKLVRGRYGNPILVWVLLNIVVPVVVKLIIEWWMNRNNVEP